MTEAEILHGVRLALGREADVVLWRNTGGYTEEWSPNGTTRGIRYGLTTGAADLVGVLAPSGRWFALEVKSAKGQLTPEQTLWLALVRRMGGFAGVVRSVDDARAALVRARAGAFE